MNQSGHILIVDDEETLCDTLAFNLEQEGYSVDTAYSAEEALTLPLADYDLVLLDIMMGDISGLQLAKIMKSNPATASVAIIFCTARDTEDDLVEGLDLGADDYIAKPYSLKSMLARIRTVLRRTALARQQEEVPDSLIYKGLELSRSGRICIVDGREVKMPKKEFEILLTLLSHPGEVFSREKLLSAVWPDEVVVGDRVVDVNITRIRQKIAPYGANIVTRSGYGYCFVK